jgi:ribonuclease PH|tara:strand:- start:9868 stop:10587 length:720 start_codon:yes stop_codon:yes gene_type:complete
MRKFNRKNNQIREITIEKNINLNADGSCLITQGNTKVICTATFEKDVPIWLKNKGSGWVTAEYSMLPASTSSRNKRESKQGKQTGRTIEIQRLIGRSLRTVVDLKKLNCGQFIVDCDVIQADGGTRTTSVTGAFVAMSLAIKKLLKQGALTENPIKDYLAAISCGIINSKIFIDLDYEEDSNADVDANFIFAKKLGISEVQISGEGSTFSLKLMNEMIKLSTKAVENIFDLQKRMIGKI